MTITVTFTIADLPRSAFKTETDAEEWLANNASAITGVLTERGNFAIETYLETDGLVIDYDEGYFDAPTETGGTTT